MGESSASGGAAMDIAAPISNSVDNCQYYCHESAAACSNCNQGQCTYVGTRFCARISADLDTMMMEMGNASDLDNCNYHCHETMATCVGCWGSQGQCHEQDNTWCAKASADDVAVFGVLDADVSMESSASGGAAMDIAAPISNSVD